MAYKLVHYINQFFAGIGGEDKADVSPEVRDGIVGPGMAFKAAFNGEAEIVAASPTAPTRSPCPSSR